MQKYRSFPRYSLKDFQSKIKIFTPKGGDFQLGNVSLGGLKLLSSVPVDFNSITRIELEFLKQELSFKIKSIWQGGGHGNPYKSGYKIEIENEREFSKWLNLMRALHMFNLKRRSKESRD